MQQHECPYCSLAKKQGELYCSRHASDMRNLKSGVFCIEKDRFDECDWHITRLSLNFNLDGSQTYHTPERAFSISPHKYLLLNEGQKFKTSSQAKTSNRMITVAFQVGLADKLMTALTSNNDSLLDDPFNNSHGSREFLEKTYAMNSTIHSAVSKLVDFTGEAHELDQRLEDLLLHLLQDQLNVRREILSISSAKTSTKVEIYRRLHWSLDFLHENFTANISVENLAEEACLSSFHYKRLFTELFHISPYQYLINLRLDKARTLLHSDSMISVVCKEVGWKDPSSFTRLFKKRFNLTPLEFKTIHIAR